MRLFVFSFWFADGIIIYANIMFMTDHNLTKTHAVCLDNENSVSVVTIRHTDWWTSVQDFLNERLGGGSDAGESHKDYLLMALRTTEQLAQYFSITKTIIFDNIWFGNLNVKWLQGFHSPSVQEWPGEFNSREEKLFCPARPVLQQYHL